MELKFLSKISIIIVNLSPYVPTATQSPPHVLKGTFEEKVKILEDYEKNNKIFFSPYAPSARFRVVEY